MGICPLKCKDSTPAPSPARTTTSTPSQPAPTPTRARHQRPRQPGTDPDPRPPPAPRPARTDPDPRTTTSQPGPDPSPHHRPRAPPSPRTDPPTRAHHPRPAGPAPTPDPHPPAAAPARASTDPDPHRRRGAGRPARPRPAPAAGAPAGPAPSPDADPATGRVRASVAAGPVFGWSKLLAGLPGPHTRPNSAGHVRLCPLQTSSAWSRRTRGLSAGPAPPRPGRSLRPGRGSRRTENCRRCSTHRNAPVVPQQQTDIDDRLLPHDSTAYACRNIATIVASHKVTAGHNRASSTSADLPFSIFIPMNTSTVDAGESAPGVDDYSVDAHAFPSGIAPEPVRAGPRALSSSPTRGEAGRAGPRRAIATLVQVQAAPAAAPIPAAASLLRADEPPLRAADGSSSRPGETERQPGGTLSGAATRRARACCPSHPPGTTPSRPRPLGGRRRPPRLKIVAACGPGSRWTPGPTGPGPGRAPQPHRDTRSQAGHSSDSHSRHAWPPPPRASPTRHQPQAGTSSADRTAGSAELLQ